MKFILFLSTLLIAQLSLAQTMSPDSFARQLTQSPQGQLIDVRTAQEFAGGHLDKAINLDFKRADFEQAAKKLDPGKPVFVYCLSGVRSRAAAEKLREWGYGPVYELGGGYLKWSARMMPVVGVQRSSAPAQWNAQRLDSLVRSQSLVLVDVYAPWCAPCQKMAPIIDKLSTEWAGKAVIVKLNADQEKKMLAQYRVEELPTVLLFRNGTLVDRKIGFQDEAALRSLVTPEK
ncbi:thioredoxin [Larkinella arboricola]|uniref:Thioredoxin n=1 Tax=Larkinella arboricola TaxID=643671 RepID=A0A327XAT4_LARAB|nr:thioredoxin [Larkinella arboricola]RAK02742.1 thioredoxin [Larkinella arboricola]